MPQPRLAAHREGVVRSLPRAPLTTPSEVRNALVYVLLNFRKHLRAMPGIDPRSSGPLVRRLVRAASRACCAASRRSSADLARRDRVASGRRLNRPGRDAGGLIVRDHHPSTPPREGRESPAATSPGSHRPRPTRRRRAWFRWRSGRWDRWRGRSRRTPIHDARYSQGATRHRRNRPTQETTLKANQTKPAVPTTASMPVTGASRSFTT